MPSIRCTDCKGPLPEGRKGGVCEDCKVFNRILFELKLGDIDSTPEAVAERARRAKIYAGRFERGEPIFQEELTNAGTEDNPTVEATQGSSGKAWASIDEADED